MGGNSLPIMTCRYTVISGGSHAPSSVYAHPQPGPSARHGAVADPPEAPRSRTQVPRRTAPDAPVLRRRADHLVVRWLQTPARGPFRRGGAAGPAGHPARLRRDPTAAQPCLGRRLTQGAAEAPPTDGHRPDLAPLSRRARGRSRGNRPQQAQERHLAFPRLCHRLRHPQAPPLHRGPDGRPQRRTDGGRAATPAAPGGARRGPALPPAAGPRVLQRGRDPLSPGGAAPIPDAGDLPGTQARRPAWPQRDQHLPDLEAERLERVHPPRGSGSHRDGLDRCQVPLLPGTVAAARPATAGICVLGPESAVDRLGASGVSVAVRDRDDVSADAPGADSDLDARSAVATVVRGRGAGAAERVGVVSLPGVGPSAAWWPADLPGVAPVSDNVVVVGACGRSDLGDTRHDTCLSAVVIKSYDSRSQDS